VSSDRSDDGPAPAPRQDERLAARPDEPPPARANEVAPAARADKPARRGRPGDGPGALSAGRDGGPGVRVPCAGAIVVDSAGRLLLIRRGQEPGRGLWSLPGGRCEPGEDAAVAAVRETYEETGLAVAAGRLVGRVERPGPGGVMYIIDDVACTVTGGTLRAGDDADDARWVGPAELAALPVTGGLLDALTGWGVLPPC
jgi:8-oxo-dGTP diphosphatase